MPVSRRSLLAAAPATALGGAALVTGVASTASAESITPLGAGSKTWISGVTSADPKAFATWRRSPVAILGMFADVSVAAQREVYQFAHGPLNCDVDLAVGGPIGSTWEQAAAGSQRALWRQMAAVMRKNWHYRTLYLRYAHEANGTWMPWSVAPSQVTAFRKTFRMFAATMRKELAGHDVKIVFAPNYGTWRYSPSAIWPGADVVDVVGVSMYEWASYDTEAKWRAFLASSIGPVRWSKFARSMRRPMALSEWGGHSPFFLRHMNAWMRNNAGRGAGQLLYDVYHDSNEFVLNGSSAAAYRALRWGR